MTRTSLLKTATLALLAGAMTIPSMASANAPSNARGSEYNQRDNRGPTVRDVRNDRRDDRREVRRTGYKYGYGAFNAPFRAQYFRAGDRIGGAMLSSRYIINNPRHIGLPFAGRNKAYVRHFDDVLLVNLRSGKVIAVYRNHLRW